MNTYLVEEHDFYDLYSEEEPLVILETDNLDEAIKSFRESSYRSLSVIEDNDEDSFTIVINLKGIIWGYPDDQYYVPMYGNDLTDSAREKFNYIVNILEAVSKGE